MVIFLIIVLVILLVAGSCKGKCQCRNKRLRQTTQRRKEQAR